MSEELEILGAAAVGAVARDTTGDGYLNGPCPNCGEELEGQYCANCGQSAKDMKKPFVTLATDALGDVFAFDSRLFRTVPAMLFRPGHVTRSYLEGRRMRYVPPFRMFLIASVIFFLVVFGITENQDWLEGDDLSVNGNNFTPASLMIEGVAINEIEGYDKVFDEEGVLNRAEAELFVENLKSEGIIDDDGDAIRLLDRLEGLSGTTLSRVELFTTLQKWIPRISFLLVPIFAITFTMMHFWIRRIYIYDHLIVALHLQTFYYMAATLTIALTYVSEALAWTLFGVGAVVYPFMMMGRSYQTHWFFNIFRMFTFIVVTFTAIILLVVAVSLVSANDLGLLNWSDVAEGLEEFGDGVEEGLTN